MEPAGPTHPIHDAPFVINSTDKAGLIIVLTTFWLTCVWIMFCIRLYIRKKNGKDAWKWDDTCVTIATVLTTVRSAVVYLAVDRGYGKSSDILSGDAIASIGKAVYGDNILFFLAIFFSKCAVLLLCQRMTPKKEHLLAIAAIFGVSLFWAVLSILLISINCSPGHAWVDLAGQCAGIANRWRAICALDIVTEFAIFCCAIYLVYGLHMSWYLKSIVILAFGIRLPTIIFSGAHLHAVFSEISSTGPTLQGAITTAWKQVELDFAICACTFSSLGAFLKPFDKELGPSRSDTGQRYALSSNTQGYQMNSLSASGNYDASRGNGRGNGHATSTSVNLNLPIMNLRPDVQGQTVNTVMVDNHSNTSDRISVESNDSKKGIIMKEVQWTVQNDERRDSDLIGRGR